jgi:hypothetical protein
MHMTAEHGNNICCNIVSVSWGDHLFFGEGDGRLDSLPAVRRRMQSWKDELGAGNFDGLFVCLRSQSRPADFADQFGFNQPVRDEFLKRYGRDIWVQGFGVRRWRDLLGEYLTVFLMELKDSLKGSHT